MESRLFRITNSFYQTSKCQRWTKLLLRQAKVYFNMTDSSSIQNKRHVPSKKRRADMRSSCQQRNVHKLRDGTIFLLHAKQNVAQKSRSFKPCLKFGQTGEKNECLSNHRLVDGTVAKFTLTQHNNNKRPQKCDPYSSKISRNMCLPLLVYLITGTDNLQTVLKCLPSQDYVTFMSVCASDYGHLYASDSCI